MTGLIEFAVNIYICIKQRTGLYKSTGLVYKQLNTKIYYQIFVTWSYVNHSWEGYWNGDRTKVPRLELRALLGSRSSWSCAVEPWSSGATGATGGSAQDLSIYLSIYRSIDLSIYRSIDLSIDLSIYRSIDLSIYLYLSISIYIYLYLSISIYIYLYLSISIYI